MPCRELRFVLSVVFYVVNKNPQNRIRSKSCRNQKKTPEIQRFQVLFCHVLIKKMCTLESSKGRRRRPSRKKPVATRVVVSTHASEQVVGARLFAEKEKQSKLCSNVVGVSLKDL